MKHLERMESAIDLIPPQLIKIKRVRRKSNFTTRLLLI